MFQGIQLSMFAGPMIPVPVNSSIVDALVSATVRIESSKLDDRTNTLQYPPSGFELEFNLGKDSPLETIFLLQAAAPPLIRVVLAMNIQGQPEPIVDGFVLKNKVTPANGNKPATVKLIGEDLSAIMNFIDCSGVPFPGIPIEHRVATLITKYSALGIIPMIIPPPAKDIESPSRKIDQQQGTDLAYLQHLARGSGYVFYLEPGPLPGLNKAYWGPEVRIGIPQPALNLDMDAMTNVDSISFDYEHDKAVTPIVEIQPQGFPFPIPVPIPSASLISPPLGLLSPMALTNQKIDSVAYLSLTKAILKGLAAKAHSSDVVTASGTLNVLRYGRLLKARQLVGVRGAGKAFDGLYYVKSVTHEIKRGEYKQSFTLVRNGLISTVPKVPV
jgi:hypothetical protein